MLLRDIYEIAPRSPSDPAAAGDPPPTDPPAGDPPKNDPPAGDPPSATLLNGGDGDGDQPKAFLDMLSVDHRRMAEGKGWKEPGDVMKAYAEIEAWQGRNANQARVPGENATDEDKAAYRKAIGVPDKPADYVKDFKFSDGVKVDEGRQETFLKGLHERNAPPDVVNFVMETYDELARAGMERLDANIEPTARQQREALEKEWGNDAKANFDLAERGLRLLFTDDDMQAFRQLRLMDGSFVGDQGFVVKALNSVGRALSESSGLPGARTVNDLPGMINTATQAEARKQEIMKDPDLSKAALDRKHPKHDEITKELNALDRVITNQQLASGPQRKEM